MHVLEAICHNVYISRSLYKGLEACFGSMLPGDFNQVVDILRGVVRNVQRLTDARTPRWFRHVVEEKQQKLRLNEVQEFKTAAKALLAVINDRDMQQEPLPWSVLRRHAENVPLWLDRLVKKPAEYEKYKNRLLMSIDTFVQNADNSRVPLSSSRWRSTAAGLIMMVCGGVAGLAGCAPTRAYAEEPKQTEPAKDVGTITDEQITTLMKYETVEEILKEDKVIPAKFEYVTYDEKTKTNNYDKLVFQEDVKKEDRKPVLVFFYKNKDPTDTKTKGTMHREAITLKKLQQYFGDKIKFVAFEANTDPELSKKNYTGIMTDYDIKGFPSIAMYSNQKGVISRIDTRCGGTINNNTIVNSYNNARNYWINPNLFSLPNPDNDGKVYKFNNASELKEVAAR